MNIKQILHDYHHASASEKVTIETLLKFEFQSLSNEEKKEVQKVFLECLDTKINEAKSLIGEAELIAC